MAKTIESEVAKTILQKPNKVVIGKETYLVAPPTTATLILMSEAIAELPDIRMDGDNLMFEALAVAKDCRAIGDVLAILILGANNLEEQIAECKIRQKKICFGLITKTEEYQETKVVDRKAELSKKILMHMSPQKINELLNTLLGGMQIAFFFATTTSLIEVNLLRRTKKTTVSGLPSPE